jgi:hypothetical protein
VLDVAYGVALGELQLGEYGVDFHLYIIKRKLAA